MFASVLLEHLLHLTDIKIPETPLSVLDALTRHLHALARSYPEHVTNVFRSRLHAINEKSADRDLEPSDIVLLTIAGTIFPTSDHFHPVLTPTLTVICKRLAHITPSTIERLVLGTYLCTLSLQYQMVGKCFIPEVINFIIQGLCFLAPTSPRSTTNLLFNLGSQNNLRIREPVFNYQFRKITFADIFGLRFDTSLSILQTLIRLVEAFAVSWAGKRSFEEIFQPILVILSHFNTASCQSLLPEAINANAHTAYMVLSQYLSDHTITRRPLELHHHRPLPILSNMPKFEEVHNSSYDNDLERREIAKLKVERSQENKRVLRELRKDSKFFGREKLKEEKKTKKEYHTKIAKLTAMVGTIEDTGTRLRNRPR